MKKILLTLFIISVSVSFASAAPFSFKQINKFVSDKTGASGTNEVDVEIEPFLPDDSGVINSVPPKNNPKAAAIASEIGQPKNNHKVFRNISTNNRGGTLSNTQIIGVASAQLLGRYLLQMISSQLIPKMVSIFLIYLMEM
jgi:hypothetical protein